MEMKHGVICRGLPDMRCPADPSWQAFAHDLGRIVREDRTFAVWGHRPIATNPHWVRDHIHEMKAYKHWETELTDFVQLLLDNQTEKGFFYEILTHIGQGHEDLVGPECLLFNPEEGMVLIRLELEADVEYLMVEAAWTIFQATGNEGFLRAALPRLEKAIDYITSDPKRWDEERGLVKRTFTIDTWDFTYGHSDLNRRIDPDMPMGIMHGDNSGVYAAMLRLADLNVRFGAAEKAESWRRRAGQLRQSLNAVCWNGDFYTHHVPINHEGVPGQDETKKLSLSNAYDINRGVCTQEQIDRILAEYQRRRETTEAFAEWFSIDPPYPRFYEYEAGRYINGGVSSFCAGELCRAAFQNGHEAYGWDILQRLKALCEKDRGLAFLYSYTGEDLGGGPSGWGSAAVVAAVEEGLAGIEDQQELYRHIRFSPRWAITGMTRAEYSTGYLAGRRFVHTEYLHENDSMRIWLEAPSERVDFHVLLPEGKRCRSLYLNGVEAPVCHSELRQSLYLDGAFDRPAPPEAGEGWPVNHQNDIRILLEDR